MMFRVKAHKHEDKNALTIGISNRTVIRVLAIVFVWIVGIAALRRAQHALILVATAFFLALALNSPVHWLADHLPGKRRGSRSMATGLSFLVIIALLAGFLASIVPPLTRQTETFITAVPRLVQDVHNQDTAAGSFVRRYKLESQVDHFSDQLSSRLKNIGGTAVSSASTVLSSVFSVLTILALTFMMLIEGPHWLAIFRDLVPDEHHKHLDRLAADMYRVVKGYVNGQVTLAALAAALIVPMLFIFHVSYPIALMVVIFICGLIPLVGHTIGAVIVTSVALFHSLPAAIVILIYYILYQQVENYVIQPRIQANSTNMSPLLVFSSVVIGVSFGGLFGGLVTIPVAGCLRVAALDYLLGRHILSPETVYEAEGGRPAAVASVKAGTK